MTSSSAEQPALAAERFGVPADAEADERLRADLAAIREAERRVWCRHPDHIGLESCLHRHPHG